MVPDLRETQSLTKLHTMFTRSKQNISKYLHTPQESTHIRITILIYPEIEATNTDAVSHQLQGVPKIERYRRIFEKVSGALDSRPSNLSLHSNLRLHDAMVDPSMGVDLVI